MKKIQFKRHVVHDGRHYKFGEVDSFDDLMAKHFVDVSYADFVEDAPTSEAVLEERMTPVDAVPPIPPVTKKK